MTTERSRLSPRARCVKRLEGLKGERSTWIPHWQDIGDYFMPRSFRYLSTNRNNGTKRNDKVINSTPIRALRVLAAGMTAGLTSPARPWFKYTLGDPDLVKFGPVKEWLYQAESAVYNTLHRSNFYKSLPVMYRHMGGFGTTCMHIEEDDEDAIRTYVFPVGQYSLANSRRGAVDTVFREFQMTVAQMVEDFGLDKLSANLRKDYEAGELDKWVDVVHLVEPNTQRAYGRLDPKNKPWASRWFEAGASDTEGFLRESGFDEIPFVAGRWDVEGEDVYGSSPAMDALGDAKALQTYEKRKAEAAEKMVRPPMRAPSSLRNGRASLLPGDVTYADQISGGTKFEPAMQVDGSGLSAMREAIYDHERRINDDLYSSLWLMMAQRDANGDDVEMTAREVAERHEEKMLMLGPVIERLHDEVLDPAHDRIIAILLRRGDIPPPPPEIQGMDLRPEYISIMAQAQKLLGTKGVERLTSYAISLSVEGSKPDALDPLDTDLMLSGYADMLGVDPRYIRTPEAVQAIRKARADAQQAQERAAMAQQMAEGAKTLSETKLEDDNGLNRMLGALGPMAQAAGGVPQ